LKLAVINDLRSGRWSVYPAGSVASSGN